MKAKPTIFDGLLDDDLVSYEPLHIPGGCSSTQPLAEPVEMDQVVEGHFVPGRPVTNPRVNNES